MSKRKTYPIRTPRSAAGGIRAQVTRGAPTRTWWTRRWIQFLECLRMGARLGRGRNYALSGQVISLNIAAGEVSAVVQGSRTTPYTAQITFRIATPNQKKQIVTALRARPMCVARLLVNDLPMDVDEIFREAGLSLFPEGSSDIQTHCSCPDYANPCKHLAAILFLVGEAIARQPMMLLILRGIDTNDLCRSATPHTSHDPSINETIPDLCTGTGFYHSIDGEDADTGLDNAVRSSVAAPLIRRLGAPPFWRGEERFCETMERLYRRAAIRGLAAWTEETVDFRREDEKHVIVGERFQLKHRCIGDL